MIGIYGSNGFIGRHLVRRLAGLGVAAKAVSRRHDESFVSEFDDRIEFVQADLTDPLAVGASLQDVETVVQLISTSSPGLRNDHAVVDIQENVIPHVSFLQDCVRAGVKRYVFLSSGGTVYGPGTGSPMPETGATDPICSHGLTKIMVEKYIQMHGHLDGLEYVILRLANPFGPGQEFRKGQGLIPAILDRYRTGQPIRIFGKGEARRDFVYIGDVIDAIVATLDLQADSRLVLNIGSGETRSVLEVVEAIEAATGHRFERKYIEARNTDVDVSSLDISRAREVLGWTPRTSFESGIRQTVEAALASTGER